MQHQARRCGNCGESVGAADITCPHCDALLAAYEAPAGSVTGTDSAVTPVSMPEEPIATAEPVEPRPISDPVPPVTPPAAPYESLTGKTLSSLEEERPEVGTISSSLAPDSDSPVTQALQQTRIAADLDEPGVAVPQPEPPAPTTHLADERQPLADALNQQTAAPAAPAVASPQRPRRPTPENRGSRSGPPVPQRTIQNANPHRNQPVTNATSVSAGAFIGILVFFVILSTILRSGTLPGILVIFVVIGGIFWYMTTVAKNTGRKSTAIPKDRNRRR